MRTRSQTLALSAYEKVKAREGADEAVRQRYGGLAHELPILIHTAGLAQALSFVEARGGDGGAALLDDLAGSVELSGGQALARASREAELMAYIGLTRQVLDALLWYKRFAQSLLRIEGPDGEDAHG